MYLIKHFNVTRIFLLVLFLSAYAQGLDWIEKGIDMTINNQFDLAEKHFRDQIARNPEDYRAYFYFAATLNSKMTHFENNGDEEIFDESLDRAIQLIDSVFENTKNLSNSTSAELLFYLGSAYGYRAFFQGQNGRWFKALTNGMKSSGLLQEAIEKDSTIYDAYLGIGVYKYWRHSVTRYLNWLPFISDEREDGIRLIKRAIVNSRYSKYVAIQQLIYILVDYAKPDEAREYAKEIIARYPDSQFMLWAAAHAYHKDGDLDNALEVYKHLLELITSDAEYNPHHLIKCKLKLAEIYHATGQYKNCLLECEQLLLFLDSYQEEEIKRVRALMEMCNNKSSQLESPNNG